MAELRELAQGRRRIPSNDVVRDLEWAVLGAVMMDTEVVAAVTKIVSEADFALTQEMIETKRRKHWRVRKETPNRYT